MRIVAPAELAGIHWYKVGSVGVSLSQPDLATRSYILAAILSRPSDSSTRPVGTNSTLRPVTIDEVTAIMADLKIQLQDAFHLTKEQTVSDCHPFRSI